MFGPSLPKVATMTSADFCIIQPHITAQFVAVGLFILLVGNL
ncbi:hypothetical protein NBRC111894_2678 [Sporolactobacillus inulinus]|uniref:Uncharacterized protein n=1 Tax=Sporolactobacillus inulinus TaxID=2078 RepID=A0A4Y1ZDR5_9BACL|nr:hypothetical protein NBRC111894_2678 [Sporolactobacillus inulinus]GEB78544.1 hypothetical protein SIN01_28890 [Sporolactobacillus inulinus]